MLNLLAQADDSTALILMIGAAVLLAFGFTM